MSSIIMATDVGRQSSFEQKRPFTNRLSGISSLPLSPHRCPLRKAPGSEVVTDSRRGFSESAALPVYLGGSAHAHEAG